MSEVTAASKLYFRMILLRMKTVSIESDGATCFNIGFSGQNVTEAINRDVDFYNTQDSFKGNVVKFRHLHGSKGL